ncbi:MAG TPA: hypothetical protein VJP88_06255 [Caulobacteraceae bacterium]|nr:hypothetical protein [Caulobacteraceae bacterium]
MDIAFEPSTVPMHQDRPLLIVDVDEVLALFVHGFGRFLAGHGLELRLDTFALLQNIYRPGEEACLDVGEGRRLFDDFFRFDIADIEPAPGAVEALKALAGGVNIVILTNAPDHAREPRTRWLAKHGLDYPMLINKGPKGPAVSRLATRVEAPAAFVDDLIGNLDSATEAAPDVRTFQMVADERLRHLAPTAPERHPRFDDWADLKPELARVLGLDRS